MDVTVTVRHCEVPERFRRHLTDKVAKVAQLAPRARRVTAVVSHESNPRLVAQAYCLELTVHGDGPVVRAEARADEPYAALDLAMAKIIERLRRAHDRKVVRHSRSAALPVPAPAVPEPAAPPASEASDTPLDGASPITIRDKTHTAEPMTLDQALYEMELVGHDFFLFVDADAGLPSVVYRRKGWSYGVIRVATDSRAAGDGDGGTQTAEALTAVLSGAR